MTHLKNTLLQGSALSIAKVGKKFRQNKDGVAAIEFALIAPILIVMYLGLLEISMAIMADRDVSHATNVVGDLATQVEVLDKAELENILTAAITVMTPRNFNNPDLSVTERDDIRIRIESWELDDTTAKAPRSLGYAKTTADVTKGLPNIADLKTKKLLTETSGVVVATINYDYEPVGNYYMSNNVTLYETFVLKPRRSATIPMHDGSGNPTNFGSCKVGRDWQVTC